MVFKTKKECFNTQPPEGGWHGFHKLQVVRLVSTHSRPKAAGLAGYGKELSESPVSTHSRPKAAGDTLHPARAAVSCFNTQPPEGGWGLTSDGAGGVYVSTHSRPKAAGKYLIYAYY